MDMKTDRKDSLVFLSGLVIFILLVSLIPIGRPQSTHATDVSNDKPVTYIPLKDNRDGLCTYNIVQVIGGVTRTIQALNCSTGNADSSSTNASLVFNYVMTKINSNKGGVVHVTGYNTTHPYNITAPIILPNSGHLYLLGDGSEFTVLKIPVGSTNDLFDFTGAKTVDAFFNKFADFQAYGNRAGTIRGWYLNTTGFGMIDSLWDNIFIRDFYDDFYFGAVDCWNNKINNSAIELAVNNGVNLGGSVAMGLTCADMKITNSKFLYNTVFGFTSTAREATISGNFFYKNQQTALKVNGLARAVITDNRFMDNSNGTNNTYYDIDLAGSNNVIDANQFYGGEPGNNLVKYSLLVDTFENNNVIVGNDFTGGNVGTARVFTLFTSQTLNKITDNQGYNPFGIVSQPFAGTVIIPNSGTSATPTNATDYTVNNSPVIIDSTGGVGVSITLKDGAGNTITSGLVTLSNLYVPMGDKIRFTFVNVPTVTVAFQ